MLTTAPFALARWTPSAFLVEGLSAWLSLPTNAATLKTSHFYVSGVTPLPPGSVVS